ncbi:serine/threonine protein kinase [Methylobacillus arboreus]|uniref:serine/threonine protein kinase n=1 Tax=Methylobacillus arboreus TaxID=755170 RepID=UPI001E3723BC|nr:serine/threonine-protein kinase [Methylobacillus arboreus]MCB5191034.1 serine/threonine protein kinase [Methylobacillus arboreus]
MHANQNRALPPGYQLQGYEIKKLLSAGGFSFVYIARDLENHTTVAIKEYLPNILALRQEGDQVRVPTNEAAAGFRFGLKCFFEEGRALATIEHKNIVRVLNFFRANDTVYMVMQYERGKSLQEYVLARDTTVPEAMLRSLFSQLLNGLREVHAQKLLHLDIKPANIYIRLDGSPVLLDFGSARMALNEAADKLPPSYTPGFAAPEQYGTRKQLGPWSDVYSIGASMYACLLQAAPQAADQRMKKDFLVPAVKLGKGKYSSNLLQIIDSCMALNHMHRPPSVFALQKSLLKAAPPPASRNWLHKIASLFTQDN